MVKLALQADARGSEGTGISCEVSFSKMTYLGSFEQRQHWN